MSNALAVPAVTAALSTVLQVAIDRLGLNPRPVVGPRPTGVVSDGVGVGVHLYRITHDPSPAAKGVPARSVGGAEPQRMRVAFDLHFLITVRGNSEWETQQLMATAAAGLHAVPVLTPALLAGAEVEHPEIIGNDLGAAEDLVRITPVTLSVEELTDLWALFAPGSFTVSLAVSAGPVLIESD